MALSRGPTYFQVPIRDRSWMQSIPVGWHMRPRLKGGERGARTQVLAITVEAIEGWIRAMRKMDVPKTLYPLIQAVNEQFGESRVSKRGGRMWSSLAFMDFDGEVSKEQFQLLQQTFDEHGLGCAFRSFTEGRAKVALVVNGTPSLDELKDFILKMYFSQGLFSSGLGYPDTSPQALITAFIPTEEVLWTLTRGLQAMYVHDVATINANHHLPTTEEMATEMAKHQLPELHVPAGTPPFPGPTLPKDLPQEDGLDELDAWLAGLESKEACEDPEDVEVIPYSPPVDQAWIEANIDAEFDHSVSRLDCIPIGGGWVRGWEDFEGPLPSWLMDRTCLGDQAIQPRSVDGKLLRWLLGSAKALCETGIDIPQKDVADYLGVSQQGISKSVQKFVDRGWLTQVPHYFEIRSNTSLEALGRIDGLAWNVVAGAGGEAVGVELYGHWSYKRSQLITAALGYAVGPKATRYMTLDLALRFACLEVLRDRGQKKTLEVIETLVGPPEDMVISPGHWHDSLWGLMMTGHFQDADIWFDYCARIPGIHDPANSPRMKKLDAIWSWVEDHWPSVREGNQD